MSITGIGIVTAAGVGREKAWRAIREEKSALGPLTLFASERSGHFPVGQLREELPALGGVKGGGSRCDRMAVVAAREAFTNAELDEQREERVIGVALGGSTGGMLDSEAYLRYLVLQKGLPADEAERLLSIEQTRRHEFSHSTDAIAAELGLRGPKFTICSACASGGSALVAARDALGSGEADVMIAGGVDALSLLTLSGFSSLLLVARDGCRPFDKEREGMSLGEGAAFLILETVAAAQSRGVAPIALLAGCGSVCDAHHATAPHPEGAGIAESMRQALSEAGIQPTDIDYINAHGTGTNDNDRAEGRAIAAVFGDQPPPVSSSKRYFGHTLSAAGAIEAALCVEAVNRSYLPGNLGLNEPDSEIPITPQRHGEASPVHYALSNSLGFGGANCSIIIAAV